MLRARAGLALCGVLAVGALGACGDSPEEKAQSQVCDARADIKTQIDTITSLPLSTESVAKAGDAVKAIGDDVKKIADAQPDLKGDRKEQVQAANKAFGDQVRAAAKEALQTGASGDATASLKSAAEGLGNAYKSALAPIDC
jgi:hypothetical protein